MQFLKTNLIHILRWSEKYTKADMVYFASGNFWMLVGRSLATGGGIALTIAFANLLMPEVFGTYKYVLAAAGFIGALTLSGMGAAVGRAVAMGHEHIVPGVTRVNFLWSLPAALLALATSAYYFWNDNMVLGGGLALFAVTLPYLNNFGLAKSIFSGKKDFRGMAIYGVPRSLVPTLALILTLFLTQNVLVILSVYFISNLAASWFLYHIALKRHHIRDEPDGVKEAVTFGKHFSVMGGFSQLVGNLDQLLLWHFAGPVQVALYAFALAPIREVRNFSENINQLIFPKFATKTVAEMKQSAPLRILQLLIVSGLVVIAYIVFAPFLYHFLFPQYVEAIFASQLLALAFIFQPRNVVEMMLLVEGSMRLRYTTVFIAQGAKAVLWVILIPLYGLMGAVVGMVVGDAISALTLWWAYRKLS